MIPEKSVAVLPFEDLSAKETAPAANRQPVRCGEHSRRQRAESRRPGAHQGAVDRGGDRRALMGGELQSRVKEYLRRGRRSRRRDRGRATFSLTPSRSKRILRRQLRKLAIARLRLRPTLGGQASPLALTLTVGFVTFPARSKLCRRRGSAAQQLAGPDFYRVCRAPAGSMGKSREQRESQPPPRPRRRPSVGLTTMSIPSRTSPPTF